MGMGIGMLGRSSSSYDNPVYRDRIVEVEKRVEVPVKLPNPDPTNFVIGKALTVGNYLLVEVEYPDCTNYEGRKILLCKGVTLQELKGQGHLDPHFAENKEFHSPIARFEPTSMGWDMGYETAKVMSEKLNFEDDILSDGWRN